MTTISTIRELNSTIAGLIEANVPDPLARGVTWVFIDYPRKKQERFPLISLFQTGSSRSEIGLGDQGSRLAINYSIQVWVKESDTATINGSRYAATLLRDYIADKIIETLVNKRHYLQGTYGLIDSRIESIASGPFDEETRLYMKDIRLQVIMDVLKTE